MSEQFKEGSFVVYGKVGVCCVQQMQTMAVGGSSEEYYVLAPVKDSRSSVYVPCRNEELVGRMRPLMTRQEIDDLLAGAGEHSIVWLEEKTQRQQFFREVLAGGDRRQLLDMIHCVYKKKQEKTAAGKHLSAMDEGVLQEAVRLVEEEFACALGLSRGQVGDYIRQRL